MRVLITGSSRGIGRATAEHLIGAGHELVVTSTRGAGLEDLAAVQRLALDVTDTESVRLALEQAGEIDVLVNNAGVGIRSPIETLSPEHLDRAYQVNVFGVLRMMQAVLPGMRARRFGRIINISSVAGRRSMPLTGHYAATKHALEAISEALRLEVAAWNIKVTLVEPAGVTTAFGDNRLGPDAAPNVIAAYQPLTEAAEAFAARTAGPQSTAQEVAALVGSMIDAEDPPLRVASSSFAQSLIDQRRTTDDRVWEQHVIDGLGLPTETSC
jgi:NADP-dependent 3-hydroxy acid dehydrogenase YdfG